MILIERVHPKWGIVKLEVRKHTYHHSNEDWTSIQFYYPSGEFMGEWDTDRGGGLGHSNEVVDKFLRGMNNTCYCGRDFGLLELDEEGYLKLEDILTEEVNRLFPGFLQQL